MTKLCPKCLKHYKRTTRKAKKPWPSHIYHYGDTRLCQKHLGQKQFDSANRRARKLLATPAWANKEKIKEIYLEASKDSTVEVDHIVPLRGRHVSGLHVENNLQIIKAHENRKKSNKFTS